MKQKLAYLILPFLVVVTMSLIYFLPKSKEMQPASLIFDLPVGMDLPGFYGEKRQESQQERMILSTETEFRKADYIALPLWNELIQRRMQKNWSFFAAHISLIMSGSNMNDSIHRPELCLPSQGHSNLRPSIHSITLGNGRVVKFTRLKTDLQVDTVSHGTQTIHSLVTYVFIGHGELTHSHVERVILDMKRRVLFGEDQRWAYIQTSMQYGELLNKSEQQAEEEMDALLEVLLPRIIKWNELN